MVDMHRIERKQFLQHYRFDEEEARRLEEFQPLLEERLDGLLDGFYRFIFAFEHARVFLDTDATLQKHRTALRAWLLELFGGRYDSPYFQRLEQISETHVRIGLPAHYVDAAFSYLREAFNRILLQTERLDLLLIVNRIVDINLDLLSLTYIEVGQKKFVDDIALLKRIIEEDGIVPYIQPIVDARSGRIEKFECLMRLVDRTNDRIYSIFPFLDIAKEIHLYSTMMHRLLDRSFEILPRFRSCSFTFNLGYDDIVDERFRHYLYNQIAALPDPEKIVFEILESDFIEDFNVIRSFIGEVRRFGCLIAIDDFGSGYSSMKNILELRPDYLKIDGSIVREIDRSEDSFTIVKNIVRLARDLGIQTIAEHVHNREILQKLSETEVDYYQGFYLGKPFPLSELTEDYPCSVDLETKRVGPRSKDLFSGESR